MLNFILVFLNLMPNFVLIYFSCDTQFTNLIFWASKYKTYLSKLDLFERDQSGISAAVSCTVHSIVVVYVAVTIGVVFIIVVAADILKRAGWNQLFTFRVYTTNKRGLPYLATDEWDKYISLWLLMRVDNSRQRCIFPKFWLPSFTQNLVVLQKTGKKVMYLDQKMAKTYDGTD